MFAIRELHLQLNRKINFVSILTVSEYQLFSIFELTRNIIVIIHKDALRTLSDVNDVAFYKNNYRLNAVNYFHKRALS